MMKIMGFGGFDTTKGKKVPGNDVGSANIVQKRRYRCVQENNVIYLDISNIVIEQNAFFRQYMNRRGGFNRPLDSIA